MAQRCVSELNTTDGDETISMVGGSSAPLGELDTIGANAQTRVKADRAKNPVEQKRCANEKRRNRVPAIYFVGFVRDNENTVQALSPYPDFRTGADLQSH
jgi:hypothetical protein